MKRLGVFVKLVVVVVAVAAMYCATIQEIWADSPPPRDMVIVLADGAAVSQSEHGAALTMSFIDLITTLQDDLLLAFISADRPSDVLGPVGVEAPEFNKIRYEIEARLRSPGQQNSDSLADAFVEAQALIGQETVGESSRIYVIAGNSAMTDYRQLSGRLVPLVTRFGERGWSIYGLSLPDASREALNFLESLSSETGGEVIELSISDGFRRLTDGILSQEARGSLGLVGRHELTTQDILSSVIPVAPGTSEITMVIFKESPYGSLRLSNPSGLEGSAGDRTASFMMEAPHVVVWRLTDPAPGDWKIEAQGMEGDISVWELSSNRYSLALNAQSPLPLDRPNNLSAYVKAENRVVVMEGVRLFANITVPDGATLASEMKDDGTQGDVKAGDGYYSAVLPPLHIEGEYQVELELLWLEHDRRITSQTAFEARTFPMIDVETVKLQELEPGERTKVATLYVHVQEEPYPVSVDQLTASLASPAGQEEGTLELEPKRLYGNGPAWVYDVYFTAQRYGLHTQVFSLSLEYSGRRYTYTSDSLVLSTVPPPVSAELAASIPVAAPVVEPALTARGVSSPPLPPQTQSVRQSEFPWVVVLVVGSFLVVGVAGVALYLLTRARPYGYIYNDDDKQLVDFAEVKRHPLLALVFRGLVRGSKLNVPGLEGVAFYFSKNRIKLKSLGGHPTVRVNNQPLIGEAIIQNRAWIGTLGKLYTFVLPPSPAQAEASTAD